MSIDPVQGPTGPRNSAAAGRASKSSAADRAQSPGSSDGIDISEEARGQLQVHELVVAVREAARNLPDVREDKVRQARQRIEHQYYERPEVRGAIVDSLVRAFHPQPA
jgi:hypothetical protein